MKESQDERRYFMWKSIISSVRGNTGGASTMIMYLEQLNKCRFPFEFDECLDAILENEKLIKIGK